MTVGSSDHLNFLLANLKSNNFQFDLKGTAFVLVREEEESPVNGVQQQLHMYIFLLL